MGAQSHEIMANKPLPNLPACGSPTLTNPDLVLPEFGASIASFSSSPKSVRRIRPPSPSYLRNKTNEGHYHAHTRADSGASQDKREKRGLMSRKMMLLRSRTGSAMSTQQGATRSTTNTPTSMYMGGLGLEYDSNALASSPSTAAELPTSDYERRSSTGGSSPSSEDYNAVPTISSDYEVQHSDLVLSADDASDNEAPGSKKLDCSVAAEDGYHAQRRQQHMDEVNSAILSKRAEQILANAKKRLNLMEGNLRGARDLVQPLTTANLKRATSLGHQYSSSYSGKGGRFMPEGYRYETAIQQPIRVIHAQASSPAIGRDYAVHSRNISGSIEAPERSQSAMSRGNSFTRNGRIPVIPSGDGSWSTPGLRNSRSYDSFALANGAAQHMPTAPAWVERTMRHRASPEPNLAPLIEDDASHYTGRQTVSALDRHRTQQQQQQQRIGLGIYDRPSSRTDDLKDQISGLKGKISTLKERAREDSLRRQSLSNLRTPSPFNNATSNAPEFYYMKGQGQESPPLDSNGAYESHENTPVSPLGRVQWEQNPHRLESRNAFAEQHYISRPGSRNAWAEQIAGQSKSGRSTPAQDQHRRDTSDGTSSGSSGAKRKPSNDFGRMTPSTRLPTETLPLQPKSSPDYRTEHKRTPSGTTIVESAGKRIYHRQASNSRETKAQTVRYQEPTESEGSPDVSPMTSDDSAPSDSDSDMETQDEISVYEDAADRQPTVVAHEDRDDAFDYEHFFLHSAMGSYSNGRPKSYASDDSVSSDETTRAPTRARMAYCHDEITDVERFDPASGIFPPPTPETPERLKEIERNFRLERVPHKRGMSTDSTSTIATFATAEEDHNETLMLSRQASTVWPIAPTSLSQSTNVPSQSVTAARPDSRPVSRHSNKSSNSRPSTAFKRPDPSIIRQRRDSSSERADSGIGLDRHSNGDHDRASRNTNRPAVLTNGVTTAQRSPYSALSSPPMSPGLMVLQDPATIAVNALLDPNGRALGLKDKALLFEVIEGLRKVTHRLQEDDIQHQIRLLRRRLDEAKRALNGTLNARPGTS